ncbi:hypothetical protein AX16_006747 [Volvariella volvacea WC 439]|nr:hypothetical protein AX16_006747 [Volvariella volvacea WC 439]
MIIPQPPTLELLPNEILLQIEEQLHCIPCNYKQQIFALRLTSRRLNVIFTRFAINEVIFSWKIIEQRGESGTGKLRVVNAKSTTGQSQAALITPTPEVFVNSIATVRVSLAAQSKRIFQILDLEDISKQLSPAWSEIMRLRSLTSIRVYWSGTWTKADRHGKIYQSLAQKLLQTVHQVTGGQLALFEWTYPFGLYLKIPQSQLVPEFRGLQELHLSCLNAQNIAPMTSLPSLPGDLIRWNPGLRSIRLTCDFPDRLCNWEDLFPHELEELAVETLSIRGVLPSAPSDIHMLPSINPPLRKIPLMKALQNLIICGSPGSKVDLDPLWLILKQSRARLTHLCLNYGLSELLIEYLASYQGLEIIRIDLGHQSYVDIPMTSNSFAKAVLPRHAPSLNSLHISSSDFHSQESWHSLTINFATWPIPSAFRGLGTLDVLTPEAWELQAPTLQNLLDYALEIPKLQRFDIAWTTLGIPVVMFTDHVELLGESVFAKRGALKLLSISVPGTDLSAVWEVQFPPADEGLTIEGVRFPLTSFELTCQD